MLSLKSFPMKADLSGAERIICISDIHGCIEPLRRLLDRLEPLGDSDVFVFIGDFVGRGGHGAAVLKLIMELSGKPGVYCLMGNWEKRYIDFLMGSLASDVPFLGYVSHNKDDLIAVWAEELGFSDITPENATCVKKAVLEAHSGELEWMAGLSYMLDTERFLFVHGGTAEKENYTDISCHNACKNDSFLFRGVNRSGKWVVAGHMPVINLPESGASSNPVVMPNRGIIGIDGGAGIKDTGQVNAFLIGKGERFSYIFEDNLPKTTVVKDCLNPGSNGPLLKDMWPDWDIEVIEDGDCFSRVRVKANGQTGYIKNEHIGKNPGGARFRRNTISNFLSVRAGESAGVIDKSCTGYYFVKNSEGIIGWVPRECFIF